MLRKGHESKTMGNFSPESNRYNEKYTTNINHKTMLSADVLLVASKNHLL